MLALLSFLSVLGIALLIPQHILAHVNGKPVIKINDIFARPAPSQQFLGKHLETNDIAPEIYSTNQTITFYLDTSPFITPKSTFEKTDFIWDFGDGSQKEKLRYGVKNTHTYTKEGDYKVQVYADYTSAGFTGIPEPQLLEAVTLKIVSEEKVHQERYIQFLFPVVLFFILLMLLLVKNKRKRKKK